MMTAPPRVRQVLAAWRRRWRPGAPAPLRDAGALVDAALLARLDRIALIVGRDLLYGLMGEHRASRRTAGIEFADYRPYSPGDDLRRVDWNAYARLGTLQIRQAQAEHETVCYLLLDGSPSMDYGRAPKWLAARRLAAALGYVALVHLDSVVFAAPGARASRNAAAGRPLRGRPAAGTLFSTLSGLHTATTAAFDDVLGAWPSGQDEGRLAILISDLLVDGYRDGVRRLTAAGFAVTVLHLLSPEELRPPGPGDLELHDSETGEELEIYMGPEVAAAYGNNLAAWLTEIEEWCRAGGVRYFRVRSDWPVERVLLETLRRGGVTA